MRSIVDILIPLLTFSFLVVGETIPCPPHQLNTATPASIDNASITLISPTRSSSHSTSTTIYNCECQDSPDVRIFTAPSTAVASAPPVQPTNNVTVKVTLTYVTTANYTSSGLPNSAQSTSVNITNSRITPAATASNTQSSSSSSLSNSVPPTSSLSSGSTITAAVTASISTFSLTVSVPSTSSLFSISIITTPSLSATASSTGSSTPVNFTASIQTTASVAPNPVFTYVGVLPGTTITTVAISPTLPPHNNITNSTTSGASSAELMGSNNPVKIVVGIVVGAVVLAGLCEV
ncbi:uncharacterized protein K444DRAFT_627540 [Hyaloscypha bicolor E]|uniref:Uncharacterized protein n=1 Tax=Hyaloscypha bicolor E TaxID=1095630 RepID=A0A2J6TI09_9HELO|nr:uncharacterized protein K444DRAFT_627540 [Hyaloscypha bicolor E]PMD62643.1 hypothetical protein K444DRAFT_627540 [Hyaloscypha bicolor E]